jgi:hypothetical protein
VELRQPREPKGAVLALEKVKGEGWRFKLPPGYGPAELEGGSATPKDPLRKDIMPKDPSGVRGLLNTLAGIRVDSDKDFEPLGKNLVDADKALLRIDVEYTPEGDRKAEPVKETLLIGSKITDKDKKEQYYARLASDEGAVRVGAKNVEALLAIVNNPASLRSHDLTLVDTARADAIRVSQGKGLSEEVTLTKSGLEWEVASGGFRHKAGETTVQGTDGLLGAIQGKGKVKDFKDVQEEKTQGAAEDKKLGLDQPAAKVVLWIDGLEKEPSKDDKTDGKKDEKKEAKKDEPKKDEKKDEKKEGPRINPKATPALTLTFSKPEGDVVYVKRETPEGVSRVSVPKDVLAKIAPAEGALAYLDTNIAPFLTADVARLELKQPGGKKVVVEREPEKEKGKEKEKAKEFTPPNWLLLEPKMKDRPHADADQVDRVLGDLARLSVRRWVKKLGPKDDRTEFGLKEAPVTATVTLKKKKGEKGEPTVYVYEFGTDVKKDKEAGGVYGVVTKGLDLKDIVFVVPETAVSVLKNAEFRDRTVFKFDADKVKEIKLTIVQKNLTLEPIFERDAKDKTWRVKSGLIKFDLDSGRVDEVVRDLSELKAERFVSFSGPPAKEHELGDKAKLKIEVLMDDGKTRHTLTVGALDPPNGYFAQASSLPDAVISVAQVRYGPIVNEGVSFFAKK